ncbi:GNAT family N-acetyltransferase [Chloroflexota bacterium]
MNIRYDDCKEIDKDSLQKLFLSVEWDSGNYPEQLQEAIRTSHRVITAWDGDNLVGLINTIADNAMNTFIPYTVVKPEYQRQGIGKRLVEIILGEYNDYARRVLIAYGDVIDFYRKCGFEVGEGRLPMYITYLQ